MPHPAPAVEPDELLSTEQAARLVGYSPHYMRKMRSTGLDRLPGRIAMPRSVKIGKLVRYRMRDIIEWREQHGIDTPAQETASAE